MSDEIVKRLRNRSKKQLNFLKESLSTEAILEADEDENEEVVDDKEIVNDEVTSEDDTDMGDDSTAPRQGSPTFDEEEDTPTSSEGEDDYIDPDGELESQSDNDDTYVNPLDNPYAVKHTLGDEVLLSYSNGTNSKLKGTIEGYDTEGFYRILWANGLTTNGITDLALNDFVKDITYESKCVCGGTEFVNESKGLVCDKCGRLIKEFTDPLTLADKSRAKGKKMIRSEAHPMSTADRPNISECDDNLKNSILKAFKKNINESSVDLSVFSKLDSLQGEFWTRLPELVEDIEDLGYEVEEYNSEYVVIATTDDEGEDYGVIVPIGGTSRTLTLDIDRARKA